MLQIDELRGYTYATIRHAFNHANEIVYEHGDMGGVNITSILTRIIQDVGRFAERWGSDALYKLDTLRQLADEKFALGEEGFDEIEVFGIRQDGVDHAAYVMSRLQQTKDHSYGYVYPKRDFRRILAVRTRAHWDEDLHCVRMDFSLRDITDNIHSLEKADLDEKGDVFMNMPFPDRKNPIPEKDRDKTDEMEIKRIKADGYVRFEAAEIPYSVLENDGSQGSMACTGIYGFYPDTVPEEKGLRHNGSNCVCRVYRFGGTVAAVCWTNNWYRHYDQAKKLVEAAKKGPIRNEFVWKDIVRINGEYYAEEFPVEPAGLGERLKHVPLGSDEDSIMDAFNAAKTGYFDMEAFFSDMSDLFIEEVSKMHNCTADQIQALTFGDFVLTEEEQKELPWGPESCGVWINGVKI